MGQECAICQQETAPLENSPHPSTIEKDEVLDHSKQMTYSPSNSQKGVTEKIEQKRRSRDPSVQLSIKHRKKMRDDDMNKSSNVHQPTAHLSKQSNGPKYKSTHKMKEESKEGSNHSHEHAHKSKPKHKHKHRFNGDDSRSHKHKHRYTRYIDKTTGKEYVQCTKKHCKNIISISEFEKLWQKKCNKQKLQTHVQERDYAKNNGHPKVQGGKKEGYYNDYDDEEEISEDGDDSSDDEEINREESKKKYKDDMNKKKQIRKKNKKTKKKDKSKSHGKLRKRYLKMLTQLDKISTLIIGDRDRNETKHKSEGERPLLLLPRSHDRDPNNDARKVRQNIACKAMKEHTPFSYSKKKNKKNKNSNQL
ncbi:hypothetical protein RFI_26882 [Reticulomyxa filosa]|uniref:Uncharacterized protein n=1 Tax=Reticulomyxa filosa TaxID=46433 RepID=X6M9E1_RETFI|nr:hypothetical protein RFI_26882 [Reticulomyxa filosa]|eukprot:ETO10494.1 hypothetical protein RFI_26882 [Reticulomyxa filosa]